MAEPFYMNKQLGRHLTGKEAVAPPVEEAAEETTSLVCPKCGATLTVEAETPEEERREANPEGEGEGSAV
jgi:hypothetical protein